MQNLKSGIKTSSVLILSLLMVFLVSCGSSLSGNYVSESGEYEIEFKKDGTCTWFQDGFFFEGTYEKADGGYRIMIKGGLLYGNTAFQARKEGKDLIITGGVVEDERFVKK